MVAGVVNGQYYWNSDGYQEGDENHRPFMQHAPYRFPGNESPQGEDLADMSMNYFNNSFANDPYGNARYNWMDEHWRNWIGLFYGNN